MSLDGFNFSIYSLREWCRQGQLVSAAYRGSLESVRNMLRVEGIALTSRLSSGFPHHPRVARWPLRALLTARAEASPDANMKESMQSVRQILLDWEWDLARRFHLAENMLSDQACARLNLLLAGTSSLESVPDP